MPNKKSKKIHKVVVDSTLCVGATTCVVLNPEAFDMNSSNIAIVKDGAAFTKDSDLFLAAQSCPTAAILLFDENGDQIFPVLQASN